MLGCTPPMTKRFPKARETSRGRCPSDISRAEGNLEVGGDVQPILSSWQGSIDFNTVRTTRPTGMYFLIHPQGWINDERMAVHCLESGCIRLYIPSDLEISLGPRDIPWASPSGHLSGLRKSLGRRGCTTQNIPPLGSVRIQYTKIPRGSLPKFINLGTSRSLRRF